MRAPQKTGSSANNKRARPLLTITPSLVSLLPPRRQTFEGLGFNVYGGKDAPYIWIQFPGRASWDVFAEILQNCNIVTTPGSGFGAAGEGFVRISAFGHREDILEAVERFKKVYA